MVKLLYFASLRETLGIGHEQVELPDQASDVAALMRSLQARGERWQNALADPHLIVAVNQQVASTDTVVRDGDEVAWFPPITGG
jgi:molybdopterin synthase sulfur carrier subunit